MALSINPGTVLNYTVSTTAPTSSTKGDMWFDSTNNYLKIYNGSAWISTEPIILENRTSDPASPEVGRVWIRTDL